MDILQVMTHADAGKKVGGDLPWGECSSLYSKTWYASINLMLLIRWQRIRIFRQSCLACQPLPAWGVTPHVKYKRQRFASARRSLALPTYVRILTRLR